MKDMQIIPASDGVVEFIYRGGRKDDALLLLQRLYVLLLGDSTGSYRDSDAGSTLYPMLGENLPSTEAMDAQLALACASAETLLDPEDRELIDSFTGVSTADGQFIFTLVLTDGTTVQGGLNV